MPRVGSIELDPVIDAIGVVGSYEECFPAISPAERAPYRELYPDLVAGTDWRAPCRSFLVRSTGTTILVDTGVGPPGSWPDWAPEVEGRLPDELAALGVAATDVDIVLLTHLHIDHLGWNAGRDGTPFFPRARYVVHRDALAHAGKAADRPHIRRCVEPLRDRFETVSGDVELTDGVAAFEAPGHYPGHMALRLTSGGRRAVLTRKRLVPELLDNDVLVACGHFPGSGIGRLVTRAAGVAFVPL